MAVLSLGKIQIFASVISSMTLALTSIELYFLRRNSTLERGCLEVVKQSLSVTPYFLLNSIFKSISVSLIFATFKLWGLLYLILWSLIYTFLIAYLHGSCRKKHGTYIEQRAPISSMLHAVK